MDRGSHIAKIKYPIGLYDRKNRILHRLAGVAGDGNSYEWTPDYITRESFEYEPCINKYGEDIIGDGQTNWLCNSLILSKDLGILLVYGFIRMNLSSIKDLELILITSDIVRRNKIWRYINIDCGSFE